MKKFIFDEIIYKKGPLSVILMPEMIQPSEYFFWWIVVVKVIETAKIIEVVSVTEAAKGQLISKQNCQTVTSSKKRTKDFCPGSLLLQG